MTISICNPIEAGRVNVNKPKWKTLAPYGEALLLNAAPPNLGLIPFYSVQIPINTPPICIIFRISFFKVMPHLIIVMGVSGTGKSTIGHELAKALNISFYDADDFHPASNISKMKEGIPLNDDDRQPWLLLLSEKLYEWTTQGAVLACSALKEAYRETLDQNGALPVKWVHLSGSIALISQRMQSRDDHFMPEALLKSQFDTLETPKEAITIDIGNKPDAIVQEILQKLKSEN